MKFHLVSGGCGFVGRSLVQRLLRTTEDNVFVVDDLSTGRHPKFWISPGSSRCKGDLEILGEEGRLYFLKMDFRRFLSRMIEEEGFLKKAYGVNVDHFSSVYHFAAIVGGRAKIDGDPIAVALDLSIDAEFFYWVCRHRPDRVLYASSSAAYPVRLQNGNESVALRETDISFESDRLGRPDMTYGWSKLTGEYLARLTATHYGIPVACVRPFSGYGEDQDLTYPVPALAARAARREDPIEVWGSGKQARDFVHIDDCVDCILLAADRVCDGSAVNIGSGKRVTFIEVINILCRIAGYAPAIKPLYDKPVGVQTRFADTLFASKKLKWQPRISLEEGLGRVYKKAQERMRQEGAAMNTII